MVQPWFMIYEISECILWGPDSHDLSPAHDGSFGHVAASLQEVSQRPDDARSMSTSRSAINDVIYYIKYYVRLCCVIPCYILLHSIM